MADPVSVASLGLAVLSTGVQVATSGCLQSKSNRASYMHPTTPSGARWKKIDSIIGVWAWNPRPVFGGSQVFRFRLIYECNGYDIRGAYVIPLINSSSPLYLSTFIIDWGGSAHSLPEDKVAQIAFNIMGEWNPIGRGYVSFNGQLVISAGTEARIFENFDIKSERRWVAAAKNWRMVEVIPRK